MEVSNDKQRNIKDVNFELKSCFGEISKDIFKISKTQSNSEKDNLIKNVNEKVLIQYLSPQIEKNEKTKRYHKTALLCLLVLFLIAQFISVFYFTNKILNYTVSETGNLDYIRISLKFITGYITSVIVELIAILNYIVKNVFDTSIADLVKTFKAE